MCFMAQVNDIIRFLITYLNNKGKLKWVQFNPNNKWFYLFINKQTEQL